MTRGFKGIITVPEWYFDKLYQEAQRQGKQLIGEYKTENGIIVLDHTKLRINEVRNVTDKACKCWVDSEGMFFTWIPKSLIKEEICYNR